MSARPFSTTDATAFQLVAVLEQYEQDVKELTCTWVHAERYARVSRRLDEMRVLCASLPMLSVPWMQLLISNAELVHCLWEGAACDQSPVAIKRCKEQHQGAIHALRHACLSHFTRVERSR